MPQQVHADLSVRFLSLLYDTADTGFTAYFYLPSATTRWFPVDTRPHPDGRKKDTYLNLGIRRYQMEGRGEAKDVIGIPGLWLDLDYESEPGSHKAQGLPPSQEACQALLDSGPHPPSLVVHSGHGLQAYWLFNEVWYFESEEDRWAASQLMRGWQKWFQDAGKAQGWHVDSTANLDRVFRVPGTQNHKTSPPRDVIILEELPLRYEPEDLLAYAMPVPLHEPTGSSEADISPYTLQSLPISDRMKSLLLHGDTLGKYPSRSEATFAVVNALIGEGVGDATVKAILSDPQFALSERSAEKGAAWLEADIARAHQKAPPPRSMPSMNGSDPAQPWQEQLIRKKSGDPIMCVGNVGLYLANHPEFQGKLWWDAVRGQPMYEDAPLSDHQTMTIAQWLGIHERMAMSNIRPLEQCLLRECYKFQRDLLQHWLHSLPPWDGVERLPFWLADIAESEQTTYGADISRLIPVSMVARAMDPGCIYRSVVILEGAENTGKSRLVRALCGDEWYVELSGALESKEAHMMLQGAWVAEMAELDSLSRTEETRLKGFITLTQDSWIPKYSNFRAVTQRRTIFIGTTNDSSYLKGESGNTRYLPIRTGTINVSGFFAIRDQLFAEALRYYTSHPHDWWALSDESYAEAVREREERRVVNVYEDGLAEFLALKQETTWPEIAEGYLQLHRRSDWANKSLQMQIAAAMKVLGWKQKAEWVRGKTVKVWRPIESGS